MNLKSLAVLPTLVVALSVHAECPSQFPSERPEIPEGRSASQADMQSAREAVQAYVVSGERYLTCHRLTVERHNSYMDRIEAIAAEFNGERAAYLGRKAFASVE